MFRKTLLSFHHQSWLLGMLGLILLLLSACSSGTSPLIVTAEISPKPLVGQEVTLHIEMLAKGRDLPNTLLTVELSEGIELVAGETTWEGDLPQDETVPFDLTIKVREAGEWTIYAHAYSALSPNLGFGGSKKLYITTTLDAAKVEEDTDRPRTAPPIMQTDDRFAITSPSDTPTPGPASPISKSPLFVTAEISPKPLVGQEVTLHIEMLAKGRDLPNTLLTVELSEGIELVAGETTWEGDLPQDETVPFDLTIKVREAGEWTIYAHAYSALSPNLGFGGSKKLYITTTLDAAKVEEDTDRPRTAPPIMQTDDRARIFVNPDVSLSVGGTITISGVLQFEAKILSPHPTNQNEWVETDVDQPFNNVRVELWDFEPGVTSFPYRQLAGPIYTTSTGDYSFTVDNIDPADETGIDARLFIFADDGQYLEVSDPNGALGVYYLNVTVGDDLQDGPFPFSYTAVPPLELEPFFIHDRIVNLASEYLQSNLGWTSSQKVVINWPEACFGISSCYTGGGIIVLDGDDGWDSDVILHEYAHFVLSRFYEDPPVLFACPGFSHNFATHTSDSCAWSEGWATFLQAVLQNDSLYIDTKYPDQGYNAFAGIETADLAALNPEYPDSSDDESAVMAVLWDIFDNSGTTETFDILAFGINNPGNNGIWSLSTGLDSTLTDKAIIEDFWNAWEASSNGDECGVAAIFRNYQIPLGPLSYALTISISPSGSGSVSLSPQADCPAGEYSEGTTVSLTANANSGYAFHRWGNDASGSTNPLTITINADKQIIANFRAVTATPTPTPASNNTATPTPNVTATPTPTKPRAVPTPPPSLPLPPPPPSSSPHSTSGRAWARPCLIRQMLLSPSQATCWSP